MTLEERVYKREGIVEGVRAPLPQQVHALQQEISILRQEVDRKLEGLRQDVQIQLEELRKGARASHQELRREIEASKQELRWEIQELRHEVHALANSAFNRLAVLIGILAALLAVLTFLR